MDVRPNQKEGWKKFKNGAPTRIDLTSFRLLTWLKAELTRFFSISKKKHLIYSKEVFYVELEDRSQRIQNSR